MKSWLKGILLTLALLSSLTPMLVFADVTTGPPNASVTTGPGTVQAPAGSFTVKNPLGVTSVCGLIKALLSAAIQIGIPIAVLFIVYAGFRFVLAQGNESKLEAAKHNLMYTLIGIGIFLGAWLLAQVIANTVTAIGGSSGSSLTSCQ